MKQASSSTCQGFSAKIENSLWDVLTEVLYCSVSIPVQSTWQTYNDLSLSVCDVSVPGDSLQSDSLKVFSSIQKEYFPCPPLISDVSALLTASEAGAISLSKKSTLIHQTVKTNIWTLCNMKRSSINPQIWEYSDRIKTQPALQSSV